MCQAVEHHTAAQLSSRKRLASPTACVGHRSSGFASISKPKHTLKSRWPIDIVLDDFQSIMDYG